MKESILTKLESLSERLQEIGALLGDPDVIADQNQFRALSREYAEIKPVVDCFTDYQQAHSDLAAAREMLSDDDPDMRELAQEEIRSAESTCAERDLELQRMLLPKDPADTGNVFVEIRAGTGGDEAALFSGDLMRMYSRYAESQGWNVQTIGNSPGEKGGHKEVILRLVGTGVFGQLKFESGVHRVQRVPETESQGRIHTSACTVAVLPEIDEVNDSDITINPADLRVDTFRASGAGGQHVNKTDSAIRLTHLPSGLVVECQDERSQHKNRARAMSLLRSRLLMQERETQQKAQADERKSQIGSGDRSERIRTYNYPQGRITDHRINLTLYKLDQVLEGSLELLIDPLLSEHQAEQLAALN